MEGSAQLAEYLGLFFQYITRNNEEEKRLREEIEHAGVYASIQRFRFRDMLHVEIETPPDDMADRYVPRLILQPVLENAFKYVYDVATSGCEMFLRIRFKRISAMRFDILVENSGQIDDDVLTDLNTRLNAPEVSMETTALINIHRRLRIYFGEKSGLSFERSTLNGLLVRMRIVSEERKEWMRNITS